MKNLNSYRGIMQISPYFRLNMPDPVSPEQKSISRRGFLNILGNLPNIYGATKLEGLFNPIIPPPPEWSTNICKEILTRPENAIYKEEFRQAQVVMDYSAKYAVPEKSIPRELKVSNPAYLPDFNRIPEIVAARQLLPEPEGIATILGLLGVQTAEQVDIYNQLLLLYYENFHLDLAKKYAANNPSLMAKIKDRQDELARYLIPQVQTAYQRRPSGAWDIKNADTCNLYPPAVLNALGITDAFSHWIENGQPSFNHGAELNARASAEWLKANYQTRGWKNVTDFTVSERTRLLPNHLFLYATEYHMCMTVPVPDKKGIIPGLTQANYCTLLVSPTHLEYEFISKYGISSVQKSQWPKWGSEPKSFGPNEGIYAYPLTHK